MLLNPTGGVLGGDRLITNIVLEAGTHVCLTTPSATRIYRTEEKPAILETSIRLEEGATLEYFPDHVIPHTRSSLRQSLRVEMAHGSRAILFDSMASGRVAHGERWMFTEMDSLMEVLACGRPAYLNRTWIVPAKTRPDRLGIVEDFDYLSSIGLFAQGFTRWEEVAFHLNETLKSIPNIRGGATLLSGGGCVARFLAHSASDLTLANKRLWDADAGSWPDCPHSSIENIKENAGALSLDKQRYCRLPVHRKEQEGSGSERHEESETVFLEPRHLGKLTG